MNNLSFHFTPAVIVSIIGAVLAVALSFGLHLTQENIRSIMLLVGLIAGAITVGGGIKSAGMFVAGVHPAMKNADPPSAAKAAAPHSRHR